EELDNRVPTKAQTTLFLEIRRLLDRAVRWLVTNRRVPLDVTGEIARLGSGVARLLPELATLARGREREAMQARCEQISALGVPERIAEWSTRIMYGFGLLDIVGLADTTGVDTTEVAGVYFVLSGRFRVDELLSRISDLPRTDRWDTLARMALE